MSDAQIAIVIPARYDSKRLPGKPLAMIAGKTMLERVYDIAKSVADDYEQVRIIIATDDERIIRHAETFGAEAVMTPKCCVSGSNRTLEALDALNLKPGVIINLQGDEPLIPPSFIKSLINCMLSDKKIQVATPVAQLSWLELDKLRQHKLTNPFSGTTAVLDANQNALWFSKQIIPAIRNEEKHRNERTLSPVYRHIGLYAYQYEALKRFDELNEGYYEQLEGLEQLRFLENDISINTVNVEYGDWPQMSGVDTSDDLKIAEDIIRHHGELMYA